MAVPSPPGADKLIAAERRRVSAIMPLAVVVAALAGVLVAKLATQPKPVLALLLPLLALPVVLWKWPRMAVYLVMAGAVTIEQFAYSIAPGKPGALTGRIPFFHSITPGSGVTPAEMLLFLALMLWILKSVRDGARLLPRSPVAITLSLFLLIVLVYLAFGLTHGGHYKDAIWEIRSFFYLGIMYMLASQLMATQRSVRTVLWIFVIGSPAKAVYGIILWLQTKDMRPRPESVLAHEESFFFGVYIILVVALWIFGVRGRLRTTATALCPIVLLGDMMNSRRTAWAILGLGLLALIIIGYAQVPERRRLIRRILVVGVVLAPIYLPLYWNKDGTVAQPARAIRSEIKPDARDLASNEYRTIENADLLYDIHASHDLGDGYGRPIDYAEPLASITALDPSIAFIPHDGVLYIWMRTGFLGEVLFWIFISTALIQCCRLAKVADRETAMFGALAACSVVAYVVMGYLDMGFTWFRLAFALGIFLGIVEARLKALRVVPTIVPERRFARELLLAAGPRTTT